MIALILVFLSFLLLDLVFRHLARRAPVAGPKHSEVERLDAEIKSLRKEAEPLNTTDTFAQYAKICRKINALERDKAKVLDENPAPAPTRQWAPPAHIRLAAKLAVVAVAWNLWLGEAPAGWLWPAWSDVPSNVIVPVGPIAWSLLCDRASSRVLDVFF
jgi:hypothetical protein